MEIKLFNLNEYRDTMVKTLTKIQNGQHHDPFEWLGLHAVGNAFVVRAFMPSAETVALQGAGAMQRIVGTDTFEIQLTRNKKDKLPVHYKLSWIEKKSAESHSIISPYSFQPLLSDFDLDLFSGGRHLHIYRLLGARLTTIDKVAGCLFAVWAPNVKRASVIGDFNGWHGLRHPMRSRGHSGVWELFIPGLRAQDNYKYEICTQSERIFHKTDPYARSMGVRPDTTSKIAPIDTYAWADNNWLEHRKQRQWLHQPMSIYEVHAGS